VSTADSGIQTGLVSTIIPVHNRPEMLRLAVDSVMAQTYASIEVIIADDGSTDETPDVARQLVQKHPDVIRYFRHENQGPGPARELGRVQARGQFIQYLDSDDRLLPNKFEDQVRVLESNEDCDIAYGMTRLVDQSGTVLAEPFKWTGREISYLFPGLLVDRWWCTHTPLYRRTLTDRIGPWCDMRWSQDWEYDARAGALGAKLKNCMTVVSEHVDHNEVRQTGVANWEKDPVRLRNREELLALLWERAQEAGIQRTAEESQHLARWAFSVARQCAAAGLTPECANLLMVAERSGSDHTIRQVKRFRTLAKACGVRLVGRLCEFVSSRKPVHGTESLQQSWMNGGAG